MDQGILDQIFGRLVRRQDRSCQGHKLGPEALDELAEGLLLAAASSRHERGRFVEIVHRDRHNRRVRSHRPHRRRYQGRAFTSDVGITLLTDPLAEHFP